MPYSLRRRPLIPSQGIRGRWEKCLFLGYSSGNKQILIPSLFLSLFLPAPGGGTSGPLERRTGCAGATACAVPGGPPRHRPRPPPRPRAEKILDSGSQLKETMVSPPRQWAFYSISKCDTGKRCKMHTFSIEITLNMVKVMCIRHTSAPLLV